MKVLTTPEGFIYIAPGQSPSVISAGIGFTNAGQLCTWPTPNASDRYIHGIRVDNIGRVIVADGLAAERPYVYKGGLPFGKLTGSLIRQVDTVAAASDPFVNGIRVGPRGGVYCTVTPPTARAVEVILPTLSTTPPQRPTVRRTNIPSAFADV